MAINFPTSPTTNDIYTESDRSWKFNGTSWDGLPIPSGSGIITYTPAGTGAVDTVVETKLRESVSVKDFGAVGDGVTDDTSAIQAAIDSAEADGGGTVSFPSGTYIVSDTITIDDYGILLQGDGHPVVDNIYQTSVSYHGSVIKLADNASLLADEGIIEFVYQGSFGEARLGGGVRDMVIFGNRSTTSGSPTNVSNNTYGHGIKITGARYVTLHNVYAMWCPQSGVYCASGGSQSLSCNNILIDGCAFVSNAEAGVSAYGGDSIVTNCQMGYNGTFGIIQSAWGLVSDCLIWNNRSHGIYVNSSTQPASIKSCKIYDNEHSGIYIASGDREFNIVGNTILRNNNAGSANVSETCGIYIASTAGQNCTIVGNTIGNDFDNDQDYGVYFANTTSTVRGWSGNNIFAHSVDNVFTSSVLNIQLDDNEFGRLSAFPRSGAISTSGTTLFNASTDGAMYSVYITHAGGTCASQCSVIGDSTTPIIFGESSHDTGGGNGYTLTVSGTNIIATAKTSNLTSNSKVYKVI